MVMVSNDIQTVENMKVNSSPVKNKTKMEYSNGEMARFMKANFQKD